MEGTAATPLADSGEQHKLQAHSLDDLLSDDPDLNDDLDESTKGDPSSPAAGNQRPAQATETAAPAPPTQPVPQPQARASEAPEPSSAAPRQGKGQQQQADLGGSKQDNKRAPGPEADVQPQGRQPGSETLSRAAVAAGPGGGGGRGQAQSQPGRRQRRGGQRLPVMARWRGRSYLLPGVVGPASQSPGPQQQGTRMGIQEHYQL